MSSRTNASDKLSPDLVFEILSNTRRRMVLRYLRRYDGLVSVEELVSEIAALQNGVDVEDLTQQQRKRVYVSLYQTHLPKLEEAGLIEYDDDAGEVRLTDHAGDIDMYLTAAPEPEWGWQMPYLGLSILGGLLFLLSFAGIPVIASVPAVGLGLVLMIGFALLAVIQYWRHQERQKAIPTELLEHDP